MGATVILLVTIALLVLSVFSLVPFTQVSAGRGLTVETDSRTYSKGDLITITGEVDEREPGASVNVGITDPHGNRVWGENAAVTADNTFEVTLVAGQPQYSFSEDVMDSPGTYLVLASYFTPEPELLREETTFEYTTDSSGGNDEQDKIVTAELDESTYEVGESAVITGEVEGNTDRFITVTVTDPTGAVAGVDQFRPDSDGSFEYSFAFTGQQTVAGSWKITLKFGSDQQTLTLQLQEGDIEEVTLPFELDEIRAQDTSGNDVGTSIRAGQQVMLTFDSRHNGDSAESYIALLQVNTNDGGTVYLTWQTGTASAREITNSGFAWQPEEAGTYTVKAFIWTSLTNPTPLAEPSEMQITAS